METNAQLFKFRIKYQTQKSWVLQMLTKKFGVNYKFNNSNRKTEFVLNIWYFHRLNPFKYTTVLSECLSGKNQIPQMNLFAEFLAFLIFSSKWLLSIWQFDITLSVDDITVLFWIHMEVKCGNYLNQSIDYCLKAHCIGFNRFRFALEQIANEVSCVLISIQNWMNPKKNRGHNVFVILQMKGVSTDRYS